MELIKKILFDHEIDIDLRSKAAYLDIFYFRETDQKFIKNQILKKEGGLQFIVDQIELTQSVIENIIKPKLIVVKNKESAAYWGKLAEKGIFWMGYDLKLIETFDSGELFEIIGLCDSPQRVSQGLKTTSLKNSLIFFTQHFQYAPVNRKPNAKLINQFLLNYDQSEEGN